MSPEPRAAGSAEAAAEGGQQQPPKRAVRFKLDLHADSFDALADRLRDLSLDVEKPTACASVFGGASDGGSWTLEVDEAMTHDRYMAELDAWRAAASHREPSPPASSPVPRTPQEGRNP